MTQQLASKAEVDRLMALAACRSRVLSTVLVGIAAALHGLVGLLHVDAWVRGVVFVLGYLAVTWAMHSVLRGLARAAEAYGTFLAWRAVRLRQLARDPEFVDDEVGA